MKKFYAYSVSVGPQINFDLIHYKDKILIWNRISIWQYARLRCQPWRKDPLLGPLQPYDFSSPHIHHVYYYGPCTKCIPYYYRRISKLNYENFSLPIYYVFFKKSFRFQTVRFLFHFEIMWNKYMDPGYMYIIIIILLNIWVTYLCTRCYYFFTCFALVFHEIEFLLVKYDDDDDTTKQRITLWMYKCIYAFRVFSNEKNLLVGWIWLRYVNFIKILDMVDNGVLKDFLFKLFQCDVLQ